MPLGKVYGINLDAPTITNPKVDAFIENDPYYRLGLAVFENAILEWKDVTKKAYCDLTESESLLYHDLLRFFNSPWFLNFMDVYMPNCTFEFLRSKLCIPKSRI